MDIKTQIEQWLCSNRDYQTGLFLLQQTKCAPALLSSLGKGSGKYYQEKLAYELDKQMGFLPKSTKKPVQIPVVPPAKHNESPLPLNSTLPPSPQKKEYPDALVILIEERKGLYKARTRIHATLKLITPEERLSASKAILDHTSRINAIWKIEDNYTATGKMPSASIETPPKPRDITKEIHNLRPNITKAKKAISAATTPEKKEKYQKKLEALQLKLEQLIEEQKGQS